MERKLEKSRREAGDGAKPCGVCSGSVSMGRCLGCGAPDGKLRVRVCCQCGGEGTGEPHVGATLGFIWRECVFCDHAFCTACGVAS